MTVQEVLIGYESKLRVMQAAMAQARLHSNGAVAATAIAAALFLLLGLYAVRQQVSYWWPCAPVPIAAVSAQRFRQHRQSSYGLFRLMSFYERAIRRIQGDWVGTGSTGEEFGDPGKFTQAICTFSERVRFSSCFASPELRLVSAV